jgi:hypothetical protein
MTQTTFTVRDRFQFNITVYVYQIDVTNERTAFCLNVILFMFKEKHLTISDPM